MALHHLCEVRSRDVFHRIPGQAGAAHNVEDTDDIGMPQPRRELRLAAKALYHPGIGGERRVQDLDRHVALEREVARAVHAPEATGTDLLQQLVVVAQRAPQPSLESRFGYGGCGGEHLERARVTHEVLEHLRRRVVAVLRHARQRADDHALDGGGNRLAQVARWNDALGIRIWWVAGESGVDVRGDAVHVACGLAGFPGTDFRRHIRRAGIIRRQRRKVGQAPVGIPQIGDDTLAAGVDHQGRGDDAAHDDTARVRVLERGQQIPDERHALRNRAGPASQCVREALAFDPVGGAIRERRDLAGGVDVPDRRMVELRERFGLAHEPGASRRLGREMHANRDGPLQHAIPAVIQRAIRRQRHEVVEPECRLERAQGVVEQARRGRLRSGGSGGHQLRCRRASVGCVHGREM